MEMEMLEMGKVCMAAVMNNGESIVKPDIAAPRLGVIGRS